MEQQLIPSFEKYFSKSVDYQQEPEVILQLTSSRIQDGKPGFLFSDSKNGHNLFVRTDQVLSPPTPDHILYRFLGFAEHSSVALLEKKL